MFLATGAILAPLCSAAEVPANATLLSTRLSTEVLVSGSEDGRLVTLGPGGRIETWDGKGESIAGFTVSGLPGLSPESLFRVSGSEAVVCITDAAPPLSCYMLDLTNRRVTGAFEAPIYPARISAAPDGWLVASKGGRRQPVVSAYDRRGAPTAHVDLPSELLTGAVRESGGIEAAELRLFRIGEEVWGVPAGSYEFWRLRPAPPVKQEVPVCLGLVGNFLDSAVALRRAGQLFTCLGQENPLASMEAARSAAMRQTPASPPPAGPVPPSSPALRPGVTPKSWFSAVLNVAASRDRVAVLVEPHPEREERGCRVDLWQFPGPRLVSADAVEGPCPLLVALTDQGAWLRCAESVRLHSFELGVNAGAPCAGAAGSAPGGAPRVRTQSGSWY